jgi:hypothetical protein
MEEKSKRSEKPKRRFPSPNFRVATSFMVLSLIFGLVIVLSYVFAPQESDLGWPASSMNAIETKNSIHLTLISGSATAGIINATATQAAIMTEANTTLNTLHGTITIEDLRLTAINLSMFRISATATPE